MEKLSKSIKAIAFDYGGVIELHEGGHFFENISNILNINKDDFRKVYFENNHLANVENMKWTDLILKIVSHFTVDEEKINRVKSMMEERDSSRHINMELLELISLLKQKGFKIGLLSNNTTDLRGKLDEHGISPLMDVVVISAEIGHQKPYAEAFKVLFDGLGLIPQEVVFVDDAKKSLENAEGIGYIPIQFRDNEQLKRDLSKLGVI